MAITWGDTVLESLILHFFIRRNPPALQPTVFYNDQHRTQSSAGRYPSGSLRFRFELVSGVHDLLRIPTSLARAPRDDKMQQAARGPRVRSRAGDTGALSDLFCRGRMVAPIKGVFALSTLVAAVPQLFAESRPRYSSGVLLFSAPPLVACQTKPEARGRGMTPPWFEH